MSDIISSFVNNWGYNYLKLDFLFTAGLRGRYYDSQTSGAGRLHNALTMIRKAAGRSTFLLGCGCPLWPGIGIFDGMRIGMDVNHIWDRNWLKTLLRDRNFPTARASLINTLTRSAMHNRFWINDPDCLMVRRTHTKLSPDQSLMLAAIMTLSGGMLLLSDEIGELDDHQLDLFHRCIKVNRECAPKTPIPLLMLEDEFPRGLYNPAGYLGLWNPTDRPERIEVAIPAHINSHSLRGLINLWSDIGERVPWRLEPDRISIALAPFETIVVKL